MIQPKTLAAANEELNLIVAHLRSLDSNRETLIEGMAESILEEPDLPTTALMLAIALERLATRLP